MSLQNRVSLGPGFYLWSRQRTGLALGFSSEPPFAGVWGMALRTAARRPRRAFALWACPPSRVSWEGVLLLSTGSCLTAFEYTWVRNPRPPPKSAALVALAAIPSASLVSHFGAGPPSCTRRSLASFSSDRPRAPAGSPGFVHDGNLAKFPSFFELQDQSIRRAATEERLCS